MTTAAIVEPDLSVARLVPSVARFAYSMARSVSATRAYGTTDPAANLESMTIARRAVGARDVEIQVLFCGVCHSDLHQARNEWKNTIW